MASAGNDYAQCKLKCSTQQIVKLKVLLSAFQFGIYLAHENNSIIAKWILHYKYMEHITVKRVLS